MKKRRLTWRILRVGIVVVGSVLMQELAIAQFVVQPGSGRERYSNYAEEGYRNYSQEFLTLKHYDDFGNYLLEGLNVFRLHEQHPARTANEISRVNKYRYYTNWFENLVIAKDSYRGFSTSLIIGDAIRTKFTPFTLNMARFNGIRWDGSFKNNQFTFVSSRISDPVEMPFDAQVIPVLVSSAQVWGRYLFGGHWETRIGDVLTLGATYLNAHQTNSRYDSKDTSLKGVVTESKPAFITLTVADDSPGDDSGPVVFSPPVLYVDGQPFPDALMTNMIYPVYVPPGGEVNFVFEVPGQANNAEIALVVANDYAIYTRHTYYPDQANLNYTRTTVPRLVAWAPGNVKDHSNKTVLRIPYALDTGRSIYGLNFEANFLGFRLRGEYERNLRFSKYPVLPGKRYTDKSHAFYLQGEKRLGAITLGGELFEVDADYETALNTYSHEAYKTRYSGGTYVPPAPDSGGVYDWFVDDNDDNDRYPDGWYVWRQDRLTYEDNSYEVLDLDNPRPDAGIFPGLDENNDNIPDDDQNSNGVPDYQEAFMMYFQDPQRFDYGDDWNNNGVIDARENDRRPDYLYNQDLRGYHYFARFRPYRGVDLTCGVLRHEQIRGGGKNWINYGKIEYRYYYPRWLRMSIYHVTKRVWDDIPDPTYQFNEDLADYSAPVFTADPLMMRNSLVHTTYVGTQFLRFARFNITNNFKLEMNKQFATGTQPEANIRYIGIVNKVDRSFKFMNGLITLTPQFKHRWEIHTRATKVRTGPLATTTEHDTLRNNRWVMPILRLDFNLTDRTVIRAGFQGFSFRDLHRKLDDGEIFAFRFRNRVAPENDYNAKIFMIMVTNASDYSGYKLQFNVGVQHIRRNFIDPDKRDESYSRIFVRVLAGW